MPDWLIWFIAFWAIIGCGTGCRRMWHRRRLQTGADTRAAGELREGGKETDASAPVRADSESIPEQPASAEASTSAGPADGGMRGDDTALGALQRRFVDGKISLEQYEAELDQLDRKELT